MSAEAEARKEMFAVAERIVKDIDPPNDEPDPTVFVRKAVLVIDVVRGQGMSQMYLVASDATGEGIPPAWDIQGLLGYAQTEYESIVYPDDDMEED